MENKGKMNARITGALFITATVAGVLAVIFFGSTLESPVDLAKISARLQFTRGVTRIMKDKLSFFF